MIYLSIGFKEYEEEILYTFNLFFRVLGLKYSINKDMANEEDLLVIYSNEDNIEFKGKKLFIKASKTIFNDDYLEKLPSIEPYKYKLNSKIKYFDDIVLFLKNEEPKVICKENSIVTNIDIISNAFYIVSRYEEYILKKRDEHERFEYKSSVLCQMKVVDRPIVNEYIEFFYSLVNKLKKDIKKINVWNDSDYAICITHDIDTISKYRDKFLKSFIVEIVKERNIKKAFNKLKDFCRSYNNFEKDPYWTFDYLINLEEKYNYTATYFFMTGGKTKKDNCYSIDNKKLIQVFEDIKKVNSEIGLHGSYDSYNNYDLLQKEVSKLNKYSKVQGIRQHYLRFDMNETWTIQEKNGIKYDATLGFADMAGFRSGLCYPFKPFNLKTRKEINIWEIPLIVMDGTLKDKEYMGLSTDDAISYSKLLLDRVKSLNGVFTILWHNSSFDDNGEWSGWGEVYEEILQYASETNAIGKSGMNIISILEETVY